MRKYVRPSGLLPLAIVGAGLLSSGAALASNGSITFMGTLLNNTCSVSAASKNLSVTLPSLNISDLNVDGAKAGASPFTLTVTGCDGTVNNATAYFENNPNVDMTTGNLKATGGATNVQFQLTNADASIIQLNQPSGLQKVATTPVTGGVAKTNFTVRYVAVGGPVGMGVATGTLTYSINYN